MTDFVYVADGVFSVQFCEKAIGEFNMLDANGSCKTRQQLGDGSRMKKDDLSVDMALTPGLWSDFSAVFWSQIYPRYREQFAALDDADDHRIVGMKLQRTVPGQGYHQWHFESAGLPVANRLLSFVLYLNDVAEGGETEFLYQAQRVAPKAGRLVLFPAGFTHTHRGNQPLSGAKYILTGWVGY